MRTNFIKQEQQALLEIICKDNDIDPKSMKDLLESVKIKKLTRRMNYHKKKIIEVIEKETL